MHFLQIVLPLVKLFEIEKSEPKLRFDSDLAAIIKHKCNRLISVYDRFFNHHHPDRIVPFGKRLSAFLRCADVQGQSALSFFNRLLRSF